MQLCGDCPYGGVLLRLDERKDFVRPGKGQRLELSSTLAEAPESVLVCGKYFEAFIPLDAVKRLQATAQGVGVAPHLEGYVWGYPGENVVTA